MFLGHRLDTNSKLWKGLLEYSDSILTLSHNSFCVVLHSIIGGVMKIQDYYSSLLQVICNTLPA